MADITVTPANVVGYGPRRQGVLGGTVTAGQTVRKNASDQIVAGSDDSATNADLVGIALTGGASGQPVTYQAEGNIDPGGTVEVGKVYVGSTSGGIAPVDDLAGGEYVTVLGVGTAADTIKMGLIKSGVAAAGAVS